MYYYEKTAPEDFYSGTDKKSRKMTKLKNLFKEKLRMVRTHCMFFKF